jgi:hypothetical protein
LVRVEQLQTMAITLHFKPIPQLVAAQVATEMAAVMLAVRVVVQVTLTEQAALPLKLAAMAALVMAMLEEIHQMMLVVVAVVALVLLAKMITQAMVELDWTPGQPGQQLPHLEKVAILLAVVAVKEPEQTLPHLVLVA